MPTSAEIESVILPFLDAALCVDGLALALAAFLIYRFRARLAVDACMLEASTRQLLRGVTRTEAATLAFLIALAAAVRVPLLGRPLGTDEAATVFYYSSRPLALSMSIYGSPNNHLLHTALVHLAMTLFGSAEWIIRGPACIAGIILVPLTFAAARALGRDGAMIAAALVAGFPVLVDYSTDARGYTLLCGFVLASTIAMSCVAQDGNRVAVLAFAIAASLGFFTVPVMLYPFVALVVWGWLRSPEKRPILIAAGAAIGFTLALYLPVLFVSGVASVVSNPYVRPHPLPVFLMSLPAAAAATWKSAMTAIPLVLQIAIALAFVAETIRRRSLGIIAAFAAVAIVLVAQRTIPFPRVWLPLLILAFVHASSAVRSRRFEPFIAMALAALTSYPAVTVPRLRETGALPHVREIARDLARLPANATIATITPSDSPLAYTMHRAGLFHPDLSRPVLYVVTNPAYDQPLPRTLDYLGLDPAHFMIRLAHDYGGAAVYELRRQEIRRTE